MCLYLADACHNLITAAKQRRYVRNIRRLDYLHCSGSTSPWLASALALFDTVCLPTFRSAMWLYLSLKNTRFMLVYMYWLQDDRYSSVYTLPGLIRVGNGQHSQFIFKQPKEVIKGCLLYLAKYYSIYFRAWQDLFFQSICVFWRSHHSLCSCNVLIVVITDGLKALQTAYTFLI